jgi:hypothetical protein
MKTSSTLENYTMALVKPLHRPLKMRTFTPRKMISSCTLNNDTIQAFKNENIYSMKNDNILYTRNDTIQAFNNENIYTMKNDNILYTRKL